MIRKVLTIFLLSTLSFFSNFTSIVVDAGDERIIYLSATEYDYPPFSVTENGEADGFSVDLLKAVAEEMGIVVSFKIDKWTTLKDELKNGELDILPLVGYTIERDEVYDFTVPYIVMRGNIFIRKGETTIESEEDLFGKEILVLDGDNSQEWAWSIGLDEELTYTTTYTEAFELLSSGEYDAVLAQGLVGEKIISDLNIGNVEPVYIYENGGATRLKLNLEGYEQKFCFAVVEGDSELLSILNEGLVIVSANGRYNELFEKWFPFLIEEDSANAKEVLTYVGLTLIPIIGILLVGYVIQVRKSVRNKTKQIEKNSFANKTIINAFQSEFSSPLERYDFVLNELIILTNSENGFIFNIDSRNNIRVLSCSSNLDDSICNHSLLENIIKENTLLKNAINSISPTVSNNYTVEYPDENITIFGQDVFRLLALPIKRDDTLNMVVLVNKTSPFIENDIAQSIILMNGLWTMLDREEQNDKIEFMSFHDSLTGLYNRRFFEEQMKILDNPRNYPITIMMGDVNGLKLVNDAFGHTAGDQLLSNIGSLLSQHSRSNDIVARWGGDEFVVILPKTEASGCEALIKRIQSDAKKFNYKYGLTSIAFGQDTKTDEATPLEQIFLNAEELMYKNKLEMVDSVRGETITTVLNTLFEKSPEIKSHSERVSKISVLIAQELNLSKNKIADIKIIGIIHDIGKIIIDLSILNSPNKLTKNEREIINMHSLSGSRMLGSTNEYTRLVPGVLHHHERWDGNGYPNGIIGDSIPIESRIICVADAYDAMTSSRTYRLNPMTKDEAITEIKNNSGKQFDPTIVEIFVSKVVNSI